MNRRLTEDPRPGMAAGIAKKPGNAGGVKAATVIGCERANINCWVSCRSGREKDEIVR